MWNIDKWAPIGSPAGEHTGEVASLAFSRNGQQLLSGGGKGGVRLWDVVPAQSDCNPSDGPVLIQRLVFSTDAVMGLSFTCGETRFISGSLGGIVRIWNARFVAEEQPRSFAHSSFVNGISLSPDGSRVLSASTDRTIRMWNTQTCAPTGIPLEGHLGTVNSVAFSPSGLQAVSGSRDTTLMLWDLKTHAHIGDPFKGHSDWVWHASFSSDGRRIVSGGRDKTVRLWSVQTHQDIGDPFQGHTRQVYWACESSNGLFLVSADTSPETIIWDRRSRAIVWRSTEDDAEGNNTISNVDAESIIRSCGRKAPYLWPSSLPEYTADLYIKRRYALYSNITGEKTLVAISPLTHRTGNTRSREK